MNEYHKGGELGPARIFDNPDNSSIQVVFRSIGCRHQRGSNGCAMCLYGSGEKNATPDDVGQVFADLETDANRLILGAYGSILDQSEFSHESFEALLSEVARSDFTSVYFETHCTTINDEILNKIKTAIPDKEISFELGLETTDEKLRFQNLNKCFSNQQYRNSFDKVHSYGFRSVANLLVGMPYADTKTQLSDATKSIKESIAWGVDEVVCFPYNSKPGTQTERDGVPEISAWLPIEMLRHLDEDELQKVYFAWYGNKKLESGDSIPPKCCDKCRECIADFYEVFMSTDDVAERQLAVDLIIDTRPCECYDELLHAINQ
jgi:uncharacterized Fe-S cluster-containing MiaB family protein